MKDRIKKPDLVQDICKRLKSQFDGLGLEHEGSDDPETVSRLAQERADELKRQLLMEVLKQQISDLSR